MDETAVLSDDSSIDDNVSTVQHPSTGIRVNAHNAVVVVASEQQERRVLRAARRRIAAVRVRAVCLLALTLGTENAALMQVFEQALGGRCEPRAIGRHVHGRVAQQELEVLELLRVAVLGHPRVANRELAEAQHVQHPDRE